MNCPRCKCEIANDSKVCEVCGKKLVKTKMLSKAKKKSEKPDGTSINKETKFKIFGAIAVTALIIGLIVTIIVFVDDNTGLNLTDDLKDFIGEPVKTAINETDEYFADESAFDAVNFLTEFDYILEDDDHVEIDGAKYPEWAIFITADNKDVIKEVKYVDFRILKKNTKGVKVDKEINLNEFTMGDKYRKVAKAIDCDVFSISHNGGSITYEYRYYYKNDFKDQQGMTLKVVCDSDGGYIYSTSQRIIPDYID